MGSELGGWGVIGGLGNVGGCKEEGGSQTKPEQDVAGASQWTLINGATCHARLQVVGEDRRHPTGVLSL